MRLARHASRYATSSARFSQPDPYGGSYDFSNPQSLNRYAYTRNDPVNFTDPSGLDHNIDHWVPGPGDTPIITDIWASRWWFGGGFGGGHEIPLLQDITGDIGPGGSAGEPTPQTPDPPQDPTLDVDKTYPREFDCNRSTNDLFRTLRRDFSRFANFHGPLSNRPGNAGIRFTPGPITQGRVINISAGGYALAGGSVLIRSREMSVTVSSAGTTSFTFTTNPGHVLYPGTISFSARDVDPGRVGASVNAQGRFGDREASLFFKYGGGREFENATWENFLDNLQRSCGSRR